MGFAAELKDFVAGFQAGNKMMRETNESEARAEYYRRDRRSQAEKDAEEQRGVFEAGAAGAKPHGVDPDPVKTQKFAENQNEFITKIMPMAVEAEKETGIDRRVIIAQAAHESGWGRHAPGNNLFGIKGGSGPALETTEVINGRPVRVHARFRQYADPSESVRDYAQFINTNKRYAPVKSAKGWEAQIDALGRSGYATDPAYSRKLLGIARGIQLSDGSFGAPVRGVDLEEDEVPVVYAASGGLIEDNYAGNDESSGSNPAVRDMSEGRGAGGYNPRQYVTGGPDLGDMVNDGVEWIKKTFSLGQQGIQEADPRAQEGARAFAANVGAPNPQQVKQIEDTVDPDHTLSDAARAIAGWKAVYDHHTRKGNAAAAQRAAGAMLMYSKAALAQGGAIAQAAAEDGNLPGAAKAIATAVNQAPDGKRMEVGEATKDGVKYKIYDEVTGELTDQGEAKMDQVIQMATGMRNGTEFLRGVGAIKPKTKDKVAIRNEQERQAAEEYNAAATEGARAAFLESVPEKQRDAFNKLPVRMQNEEIARWMQKEANEGRDRRFDIRREDQAWREAIKQERWEQDRERMMTRDEIAQSQRQQDLDDRNKRFDQSMEARKARQRQHDAAVLARREGAGRGRLSAGERADQAIDIDREESRREVYRTGDPSDELGVATDTQHRLKAVDVGSSFDRMANDTSRKFNKDTAKEVETAVAAEWETMGKDAAGKPVPGYKPLEQRQERLLADIANDVVRGDFSPKRAAQIAIALTNPGAKLRVNRDNTVSVNGEPPVRLSERSYLELVQMHGRNAKVTSGGKPDPEKPKSAGGEPLGGILNLPPQPTRPAMSVSGLSARSRPTVPPDSVAGVPGVAAPSRPPWRDPWRDPPAHEAATTSKYDTNPARRRKEMRQARRQGVPL